MVRFHILQSWYAFIIKKNQMKLHSWDEVLSSILFRHRLHRPFFNPLLATLDKEPCTVHTLVCEPKFPRTPRVRCWRSKRP